MLKDLQKKVIVIYGKLGPTMAFVFVGQTYMLWMNPPVEAQDLRATSTRWMVKVNGKHTFLLRAKAERIKIKSLLQASSQSDSSKIIAIQSERPDETQRWLSGLLKSGEIEFFEPDYIGHAAASKKNDLPNDPFFPQQWYLHNDGTLHLWNAKSDADINIPEAWTITQGDSNIVIAILDSGVSFLEPDMEGRLWSNVGEIPDDQIDNDQNGYVDDVNGYDLINRKSAPTDDNGHGTGIAGIIGATTNNQQGISGINLNAKLMICKVLNNTLSGNYSDWIEGIYYAIDNGADVINMSVAGKDDSKLLQEAITYAYSQGVAIFTSMGNEKVGDKRYPAAYTETIAVGSSDPDDQRSSSFSNFGNHIDVLAPGNFIQGLNGVSGTNSVWAGTSMSSAVACGVGSLLLSVDPTLTPDELQSILITSAKDEIGNSLEDTRGWDPYYGFGRIDAYQALKILVGPTAKENLFNLTIYPNPTVDKTLNMQLILGDLGPIRLEVMDTQGKVLQTINDAPESRTFSFSISLYDYNQALYFLKVTTSKQVYLKRFILH